MTSIGIGDLRRNASQIIKAAEEGAVYRVTNHGQDTGVVIARLDVTREPTERVSESTGVTPEQIQRAGLYGQPRPAGYEQSMLDLVESGRDGAGGLGS